MGRSNNKKKSKLVSSSKVIDEKKKLQKALASDLENGSHEEERMQELLDVISNENFDEDIICTLATISGFVLESKGVILFLKLNGIKHVSSCILHSNVEIREKVLGVVSNFLLTGGDGVIESVHSSNIISNLTQLLIQSSKILELSFTLVSKENLKKELSVLEQALQLLTSLCETSSVLVDSMDLQLLFPILLTLIINESLGFDLRCVAGNCLYTVSEENQTLRNLIVAHTDLLQGLLHIVSNNTSPSMLLSILCSGILINVSPALPSQHISEVKETSIKLASHCLNLTSSSELPNSQYLRTQDVSLEILTNMLCSEDDQANWEDIDDEDDQLSFVEEEHTDSSNIRLLEVMINNQVHAKVVAMCQAYNEIALLSNGKLLQSLNNTRSRCWQFLSNFVSVTPLEVLGGLEHIQMLWLLLKNTLFNDQGDLQNKSFEIMDAACSAMRSIALKLTQCNSLTACSQDVVSMVANILTMDISTSGKMNLVNILGIIGKESCNSDATMSILMKIGEIFGNLLCSTNTTLLLKAEVIDASVDTFADGPLVDVVLQNTKLLENLKNFSKGFKAQIKIERSTLGENIGIVDMARINLIRFLSYKESNR